MGSLSFITQRHPDLVTKWPKIMMQPSSKDSKRVLIMDLFRGRLTQQVKDTCKALDILQAVIPGGMTGTLEPLDISVNRSI
jgi:hypothetical protein